MEYSQRTTTHLTGLEASKSRVRSTERSYELDSANTERSQTAPLQNYQNMETNLVPKIVAKLDTTTSIYSKTQGDIGIRWLSDSL